MNPKLLFTAFAIFLTSSIELGYKLNIDNKIIRESIYIKHIYYDNDFPTNFNDKGLDIAILHEFLHAYSAINGMGNMNEIEDDDFYNAVMYAGCTNGNVFNNLEEDTQKISVKILNII